MKPRTIAIAGTFARGIGICLAGALIVAAIGETVNAVLCCAQSERED